MKKSDKEPTAYDYATYGQGHPMLDEGSPEAEAMKRRILPWFILRNRPSQSIFKTAKYYDHPNGEDLFGKLVAINRTVYPYCATGALMMSFTERTKNLPQAFVRGWHYFWPGLGMASTFVGVSYTAHHLRGKDDM